MFVVCVEQRPVAVMDARGSAEYVKHWLDHLGVIAEFYEVPRNPDTPEIAQALSKGDVYPTWDARSL